MGDDPTWYTNYFFYNKNIEQSVICTYLLSPGFCDVAISSLVESNAFYYKKYMRVKDAVDFTIDNMNKWNYETDEHYFLDVRRAYRKLHGQDSSWLTRDYCFEWFDMFNFMGHVWVLGELANIRKATNKDKEIIKGKKRGKLYDSKQWKILRTVKLKQEDSCVLCNNDSYLHCHHRTYDRKKQELLSDLTMLCSTCHKDYHEKKKLTDINLDMIYHEIDNFTETLNRIKNSRYLIA